ncbi:FecR family protein [Pedobacter antarcticus]|uniref:FecR family protein n=1 Tax=Pedobacter antarcticus TaxID=34086 RepID=UPI002930FE40|nr:FecR domain-containing protein [Pedobacter antarcticus]
MEEILLLITRHLAGKTSEQEENWLRGWKDSSSVNRQTFEEVKQVWLASYQRDDTAAIHAFQRLDKKMQAHKQQETCIATAGTSPVSKSRRFALIASLTLIFIISGIFYKVYYPSEPVVIKEFTASGQKKEIRLPDGTKILLAPQSELFYPKDFTAEKRVVELQGEAYFEVSKNPHRPFIVRTATLDVQVLGTHFNVNSYKKNSITSVSLMEGKVKVLMAGDDGEEYLLAPGQELSLNKLNHQVYQHEFDEESTTGWMTNTLLIKNEKLGQVAEKISQLYGVKLIFADQATADTRLYARFKNESLLNVLETISATGNIAYRIERNKVYLTLKN